MNLNEVLRVYNGLDDLSKKDISVTFGFGVGQRINKLQSTVDNYNKQVAKLRHMYGLDQAEAVVNGVAPPGSPPIREMDADAFQSEYAKLMESEVDVEVHSILLSDLDGLKDTEGKKIAGLGPIAVKLQPILKE